MQVKQITTQGDKIKYSKIADEIGNIFNNLEWLNIFGDRIKLFGIYEDNEKIIGGFCLYEEQKIGLKIYRDPPFTPCVGPFLQITAQSPVTIMDRWKEVLDLMAKCIDSLSYSIISISLNKTIIDTQPLIWKKFKVIPGYTYILDLGKPIENILNEMSKERRNDISKAMKNNLIVKQTNDYNLIKSLALKTFSRQNKKINKTYLNKILFEFANSSNSFAFVVLRNNDLIAGIFCVYDKNTAYYLLGGYDSEIKHRGAGALAVWEAIKYAKSIGLRNFDFEGSMVPEIERYFRGFGGKLTPYYRINKARLPLEIILKFFKRGLF